MATRIFVLMFVAAVGVSLVAARAGGADRKVMLQTEPVAAQGEGLSAGGDGSSTNEGLHHHRLLKDCNPKNPRSKCYVDPCDPYDINSACFVGSDPCDPYDVYSACFVGPDPCDPYDIYSSCYVGPDPCDIYDPSSVCFVGPDPCDPYDPLSGCYGNY